MRSMNQSVVIWILTTVLSVPALTVAQEAQTTPAKASTQAVVNLNTATASQLEALPGIGPKVAERILEYRQKSGGFKKVEEILEISRSCPCLLRLSSYRALEAVSRSRQKSQQISR